MHLLRHLLLFLFLVSLKPASAQITVGDTMPFWSVSYIDWPPLWGVPQRVVNAVCKKVGTHCYVFVEDQAFQPSQQDIDDLANTFDNQFYPELTSRYGPMPDVFDQDPRVFILALDEANWAGYFDPGMQMSDSMVSATWNRHSNEREMIFIGADYIPWGEGIVAHEFGHLLHWGRDHSPEPPANPAKYWEDAWIDEQFSTFAAMHLQEDIFQAGAYTSAYFSNNPDIPLIWFSNYNQVQMFMLYMFEHFGQWDYITALINEQANGIEGVENALDQLGHTENFDDAFEQFAIANYLDDEVFAAGKYGYHHYDFPACSHASQHSVFPTGNKFGNVTAYGVDYIAFNAAAPNPVMIEFNGDDNGHFRLAVILKNTATGMTHAVTSLSLNVQNDALFIADSLGMAYDRAVLVVMNTDADVPEGQSTPYQYGAVIYTGMENPAGRESLFMSPNPAGDQLWLGCPEPSGTGKTLLYDGWGRQVMALHPGPNDISALGAGVYYIRFQGVSRMITEKLIIR